MILMCGDKKHPFKSRLLWVKYNFIYLLLFINANYLIIGIEPGFLFSQGSKYEKNDINKRTIKLRSIQY